MIKYVETPSIHRSEIMLQPTEETTLLVATQVKPSQNYCVWGLKTALYIVPYIVKQTKINVQEGFDLSKLEGSFRLAGTAIFVGGAWVASSYIIGSIKIHPAIAHDIALFACKITLVPSFAFVGSTLSKQAPITRLFQSCCCFFAAKTASIQTVIGEKSENTTALTV